VKTEFSAWLGQARVPIEAALRNCLQHSSLAQAPARLQKAVAHGLLDGGKRVRPALCWLACEAAGGAQSQAMPAAVALELVHSYSLIHDDLPCMDDDDLRRGRPTVHRAFGEATAVLAGDAMQALAFEVLAAQESASRAQLQARELAWAVGPAGMVGGQELDMAAEGQGEAASLAQVEAIHAGKTAALLGSSLLLGVLAADRDPEPWREWAMLLGRLFQATDDLLDGTATTEQLGKTAGKDAAANKATLVAVLGLEAARHYAADLADRALAAQSELPLAAHQLEFSTLPAYLMDRCR